MLGDVLDSLQNKQPKHRKVVRIMRYSALYSVVAGLALGGMLLPGSALAEKRTPFTATETDDLPQNFPWFPGTDGKWYVFDGRETFDMVSDEPRVAGRGEYSMYAIMDLTGALTLWGEFHIKNAGGGWDGFYTGTENGFTATCVGSGEYEGLISRWQWTPTSDGNGIYHWKGYIVENGPGEVPFKVSGLRVERFVPINPGQMPFYVAAPLDEGWGQASHIGVFTDLKKIGLVKFTSPTTAIFRGTGIVQAANGDLLNWVAFGTKDANQTDISVFFAGGTGRFEHAVGSYSGQLQGQSPVSYTYEATGKIRY